MNINISTTPARMVRIHTSAQNGQQLSSVDISLQNVDKMIAILTECRRQITQSRPSYTTHREAGPAYQGQPAGGYNYGGWDGCGSGGGGYGAGGCGNGL